MKMNVNAKEIPLLLGSIIICQLAGIIGAFFTSPNITGWYAELNKPFFTPPSWVFAPAWITLYTLMGLALFLVWRQGRHKEHVNLALTFFAFQLVLNALWSIVFFGFQSLFGGLIIIIVLWIAILLTLLEFWKISRAAGWLLVPYLAWVLFAATLNLSIFMLNL